MEDEKKEIEQLKEEIALLKEIANKDELTRLYNRRGFSEEAQKFIGEIIGAKTKGNRRGSLLIRNFSLVVYDIDDFKKINDTYGHQAGDEALRLLAKIIRENVRDIDVVARWGGEEMIVGLVGASANDAVKIADDIRKKIGELSLAWEGKEVKFTISGGVADLDKSESFEELFHRADKAMYRAKEAGKNQVLLAD